MSKVVDQKVVKKYTKKAVKVNPQQVATYSARKQYKEVFEKLEPEVNDFIDEILNPEDATQVVRWPNTYGLSSVYKCKTVMNARFDALGRSCVAVAPTINDSIFATWGASSTVALTEFNLAPPASSDNPYSFQSVVLDQNQEQVSWNAPIIFNNGQAIVPFPRASQQRLLYPLAFNFSGVVAPNLLDVRLRVIFPNAIANQANVRLSLYGTTFGLITSNTLPITYQSGVSPPFMGCNFLMGDNTTLTAVNYISIELIGTVLPYRGPVYVALGRSALVGATANAILPNHAQHVGIYDIKDAGTIAESASQAFVLSQSLLLTAEMSDINNGGMLAIARVPAASPIGMDSTQNLSSINTNNWYEWLASLANNNYDGPVKDGAYSWFLGEDETAYFYRPIDNYFTKELPYLAAEFTVLPSLAESAVVRIKISTIVQFTTTASLYDQRPSCYMRDLELCHHMLSLIPASYSNDGHKEGLKKALKAVGGKVKTVLRNPKTYQDLAKFMGMIAPLLL